MKNTFEVMQMPLKKRVILKARTRRELEKEIASSERLGYLAASEIKFFEDDDKPYQILMKKGWRNNHENYQ